MMFLCNCAVMMQAEIYVPLFFIKTLITVGACGGNGFSLKKKTKHLEAVVMLLITSTGALI